MPRLKFSNKILATFILFFLELLVCPSIWAQCANTVVGGSIKCVQPCAINVGFDLSASCTTSSNITSGNVLVGIITHAGNTITESLSGCVTWTQIDRSSTAGGITATYIGSITTTGACTITLTISSKTAIGLAFNELSGVTSTLDAHAMATAETFTSSPTTPSITTTVGGDYILSAAVNPGANGANTFTAGSGYQLEANAGVSSDAVGTEGQVQAAAGAVSGSFTVSTAMNFVGATVALKASAGGPPPCTNFIALLGAGCQ